MATTSKHEASRVIGKGRITLGMRLNAWWAGESLGNRTEASASGDTPSTKKRAGTRELERIDLLQEIWGPGFTRPDSSEFFADLVSPMGPDEQSTLYLYGCDMAFSALDAATQLGCYLRGFDDDPEIIAKAEAAIIRAEMERQVEVAVLDPMTGDFGKETARHIFSRDYLWSLEEKLPVMRSIRDKLQPNGQWLITDYVLGDDTKPEDLQTLNRDGACHDHLWSVAQYNEAMENLGLDLRVAVDMSDVYYRLIAEPWKTFADPDNLEQYGETTAFHILEIAELWTARCAALADGRLKAYRFLTIRPG